VKTIVITGGGSDVGKTSLATALERTLAGSRIAKLGKHPASDGKENLYFPIGTKWSTVYRAAGNCSFLIMESGSILDDPDFNPDLVIFLHAPNGREDKPGSERRLARADLVRAEAITAEKKAALQERLGLDDKLFSAVLDAVDVRSK
jgi:hypothetical protein